MLSLPSDTNSNGLAYFTSLPSLHLPVSILNSALSSPTPVPSFTRQHSTLVHFALLVPPTMASAAWPGSDSPQMLPRRRRDRLRAFLPSLSRRSSISSMSSIFRRGSPRNQTVTDMADRGDSDLVSRLEALDPWFEEDIPEATELNTPPSVPTPGSRTSRRLSMTLRGLLDPRLRIPRNRDGLYLQRSPSSLICVPSGSFSPDSARVQSGSRLSYQEPTDLFPPTPTDSSFHVATPTISRPISEALVGSRQRLRPRPINVDGPNVLRERRATWGPGQPFTEGSEYTHQFSSLLPKVYMSFVAYTAGTLKHQPSHLPSHLMFFYFFDFCY